MTPQGIAPSVLPRKKERVSDEVMVGINVLPSGVVEFVISWSVHRNGTVMVLDVTHFPMRNVCVGKSIGLKKYVVEIAQNSSCVLGLSLMYKKHNFLISCS